MKAARIREYNKPLVLEDVPIPDVQPDEVLVQVRACGMCRSDVQLVDGYFRKYRDIPTQYSVGNFGNPTKAKAGIAPGLCSV